MANTEKIVTDEARALKDEPSDGIFMAGGGVRIRINPVSTSLITELQGRIPVPDIPVVRNEEIGRDVANPDDPAYLRALNEAEMERGKVAMDAAVMFGIELIEGLPEDDSWIGKLKRLNIDIDEDDETELDFAFKKYVVADIGIIGKILGASGVTDAQMLAARESFQSDS